MQVNGRPQADLQWRDTVVVPRQGGSRLGCVRAVSEMVLRLTSLAIAQLQGAAARTQWPNQRPQGQAE
jgi:hypothetical protein